MIEILMGIGILMVLGLLFPQIYGKRASRSMIVKISGMMYVLFMFVNVMFFIFFGDDNHSNQTGNLLDITSNLASDLGNISSAGLIDSIPGLTLDRETKQAAVIMMDELTREDAIIRINPSKNIIYIDPTRWIDITLENKKVLCVMSAVYFTILNDNKELRATVKNVYSNKVYAEFKSGVVYCY